MNYIHRLRRFPLFLLMLLAGVGTAFGQEEAVVEEAVLNSGNTAWMITATVLVLFMTLPGLALFYGGLVRSKVGMRGLVTSIRIF